MAPQFLSFIFHLPKISFLGCLEVPFFGGVVIVIVIVIVTGRKQSQLLVFLTKDFGWSLTKWNTSSLKFEVNSSLKLTVFAILKYVREERMYSDRGDFVLTCVMGIFGD